MYHPVVQYYNSIRTSFPRISFSFAYGSAVFKQLGKPLVSSMHVFVYYVCTYLDVSCHAASGSPATTGPPGPSMADFVAIDGPPGPTMAAMDGPLCRKWSPHEFCYKYLVQA